MQNKRKEDEPQGYGVGKKEEMKTMAMVGSGIVSGNQGNTQKFM